MEMREGWNSSLPLNIHILITVDHSMADEIIAKILVDFDEDLLSYIISVVNGMTIEEQKSFGELKQVIVPFLLDTGYVDTEAAAEEYCRKIAVANGGSGYTGKSSSSSTASDGLDAPILLAAPVKIIEQSGLQPVKQTYGGVVLIDATGGSESSIAGHTSMAVNSNSQYDAAAIPNTQKQLRKMRKDNLLQNRAQIAEQRARAAAAEEMGRMRMAAIKASRAVGKQSLTGVSIERFNLPHPSGSGDLLTDASLSLTPGRRYGLIGRNGAGKSTLLRALANYRLDGLSHLRIMMVDQHVEGDEESPLQWLLRADVERTSLLEDEARLLNFIHDPEGAGPLPPDLVGVNLEVALNECFERMDAIGVSSAETRARKILTGLGFDTKMQDKPTLELSGGWCMRAALGSALFVKPNMLLLDEPTNHLDLHALVWLEAWLKEHFTGIALIVSHDKYFLDSICTDILELRSLLGGQKKNSLEHYSGDYSTFEAVVEERNIAQARARAAYEKEKEKLKEFISREGKKYDNPAHQAQRKMKMKQLEALVEVENVESEAEIEFHLPAPYAVFDPCDVLIGIRNASFAWNAEDPPLFRDVDFSITSTSRIAIMGKNGCGKTSLLNLLTGEQNPTSGSVHRHTGSRIAMLQQHHYKGEQLDPDLSPLDHIRLSSGGDGSAVASADPGTRQEENAQRSYLASFGIVGPRAVIPVKYLSGGQRMRVAIALALVKRPDVIILDEPTNHLDAATVNALCNSLSSYEGAIVAVSHDEEFVNRLVNNNHTPGTKAALSSRDTRPLGELWVLSKQRFLRYDGSFASYKKLIQKKVESGESMDI